MVRGIAIIGQGYMGRTHATAWSALGHAERIRYVCTPRPAGPMAEAPHATLTADYDEVLGDPNVDIVSICAPTPAHAALAVRALRAGKHVLLEKPITLDVSDARDVAEEASKAGTVLMVAHVARFEAGYRRLRDDVEAGLLGDLRSVRASRAIRSPEWTRWWHDEAQSGGVAIDLSIHDLDQLLLLLGPARRVRAVSAGPLGPVELTVEHTLGGLGQVFGYADVGNGPAFRSSISVYGSAGEAHQSEADGDAAIGYEVSAADGRTHVEIPLDDPYVAQARYFLDCVRTGAPPARATVAEAVAALELAQAARASLTAGGEVIELNGEVT